jgi:transcriptional regulator with GAF, ATPase, and Fis domain
MDRVLIVPISSGLVIHGTLLVSVPQLEHRFGPAYVDLVGLMGRHLGLALDNGRRLADLGGEVETEDSLPPDGVSLRDAKSSFERRLIKSRYLGASGNIAAAARSLGMDRGQLSRLLKRYGLGRDVLQTDEPA